MIFIERVTVKHFGQKEKSEKNIESCNHARGADELMTLKTLKQKRARPGRDADPSVCMEFDP